MPTAVEIHDRPNGWYPKVSKDTRGYIAERYFRVNTQDEVDVFNATGLPALFDPHPSVPGIVALRMDPELIGGTDASGRNGWIIIKVSYVPLATAQLDATATEDYSFAEINQSTTQVRVNYSINPTTGDTVKRIPETTIEAGVSELVVHGYKNSVTPLTQWLQIVGTVNTNAVVVPPVRGLSWTITAQPFELLARSLSIRAVRENLAEYIYTFGFGPAGSWLHRFQPEDENGEALGNVETAVVYREKVFPGAGVFW